MNDTTKAAAEVDALMKLADDMQYAFLMAVQRGRKDLHKAKTDQLRAAILSAIERARAEALMQAIQRLNANPYSLTKSECIAEIRRLRDNAQARRQGINDAGALYTHPLGTTGEQG
jgi:hypothetical protein